jgi:hypothetical protein
MITCNRGLIPTGPDTILARPQEHLGRGKSAVWGEGVDEGYRLRSEGKWIIGGHDGFSRKGEDVWDVRRVAGIWVANS